MINNISKVLIVIVISMGVVFGFEWYKNNYIIDKNKDIILVFSAKDIIENKKLNIRKAVLNNGDVKKAENKLIVTIKSIDMILKNISQKTNKPIFNKSSILVGRTKDITPLVKKRLKSKGLL